MKYVKNDAGGVHSVDDSFVVPEGWQELSLEEATAEAPDLVHGEPGVTEAEPEPEPVSDDGEQPETQVPDADPNAEAPVA